MSGYPLWEVFREQQARSVRTDLNVISTGMHNIQESLQTDIRNLAERIDQLTLVCRAMHEMLVHSGAYTDEAIKQKVLEIDMRDGVKDGKFTPPPKKCPKCDAMICRRFNRCLFCGYEDREGSPFNQTE
jgi:hypothetical protein